MRITKKTFHNHYRLLVTISKRRFWTAVSFLCALAATLIAFYAYRWLTTTVVIVSPIPEEPIATPTPTQAPELEAKEKARENGKILEGEATIYYDTIEGCLGCQPHYDENGNLYFVMANGERLDSNRKTVACGVGTSCNQFPLGTIVVVQNVENGMLTTAEVTDAGGFGKLYGRILDMTPAVASQINLRGKGKVRVWPL